MRKARHMLAPGWRVASRTFLSCFVFVLSLLCGGCVTRLVHERDVVNPGDSVAIRSSSIRLGKPRHLRRVRMQSCVVLPLELSVTAGEGLADAVRMGIDVELSDSRGRPRREVGFRFGVVSEGASTVEACDEVRARTDAAQSSRGFSTAALRALRDHVDGQTRAAREVRTEVGALALDVMELERQRRELALRAEGLKQAVSSFVDVPGPDGARSPKDEGLASLTEAQVAALAADQGRLDALLRARQERLSAAERAAQKLEERLKVLPKLNANELLVAGREPVAPVLERTERDTYETRLVIVLDDTRCEQRRPWPNRPRYRSASCIENTDQVKLILTPHAGELPLPKTELAFRTTQGSDIVGLPLGVGFIVLFLTLTSL